MNKKQICTALIVISLLLMALPYGVSMVFGTVNSTITKSFSYFSSVPFGYGNWMPRITVFLSLVVLLLLLIPSEFSKIIFFCLTVSILGQILSWILFQCFSVTALMVVTLHLLVLLLLKGHRPLNE